MKKIYYNWSQIEGACLELAKQINNSGWRPDYVVGITRGGSIPAVLLSQYLDIPCEMLKVSLRDSNEPESNLWMAEDAYGYDQERTIADESDVGSVLEAAVELLEQGDRYKNILIVDDINDTGATFNWIKQDWQSGCMPNDPVWNSIWHENVKFAVITNNLASNAEVDFSVYEVNKAEEDCWLVYPWEEFWKND
jgi:hypoxanthine phosphoribosyltransferase